MAGGAQKGQRQRPSGSGSVTRAVDARGYVSYRVRVMRDGVVHRAPGVGVRRGMTESQARRLAEQRLRELVRRLDAGDVPDPVRDRITLSAWLESWSAQKQDSLPRDTTSWSIYESHLRLHIAPYLGHLRLAAIRPRHVTDWRARLREDGRSVGTIRYAEKLLKRVLADARTQEYPVSAAVIDLPPLAPEKRAERPHLSEAGLRRLLAVAEEPWRTMWLVAFCGALRFGELAGLRWRHVLWTANRLDVQEQEHRSRQATAPKAGSSGQVVVPAEAIHALRVHQARERDAGRRCADDDRVFLLPSGRVLNYSAVRAALKRHAALAQIPDVATHAFRHGAGFAAAAGGAPLLGVRDNMRHRSLSTTGIYVAHRDEAGQGAVADKLGRGVRGD